MSDFTVTYDDYLDQLNEVVKNHERILQQLRSLLLLKKDIQKDVLNSMLDYNSVAQEVVRHVIEDDINIDTIKKHNSQFEDFEEEEEE
jgi:hypothetical protein